MITNMGENNMDNLTKEQIYEIGKQINKHVETIDKLVNLIDGSEHARMLITNEVMGIQQQCEKLGIVYF